MIQTLTSFANPQIKMLRSLHDKKHRAEEGLFLAEGMRVVMEAVEAGHKPAWLIYGPSVRDHAIVRKLAAATLNAQGRIIETTDEILAKLARKDNPQMVVAAFRLFDTALDNLKLKTADIWLAAQSLKDPGNLGTLLRTADAIGAGGLILLDQSCDPFSTEAVRASMGGLFSVQLAQTSWEEFLAWAHAGKADIIGASLDTDQDYQSVRYRKPSIVLMGNEQAGLPEDYERACTHLVKIPMLGKADSLNVAVSAAVLAYEVLNQFRRNS
jgi:RNA methyltransferase, TrmH family